MSVHKFTLPPSSTIKIEGGGNTLTFAAFSASPGPPGPSAYQIAVAHGFVGDEVAWLAAQVVSASGHFEYTQSTPSATWTVNHNLGYRPAVQVTTLGGLRVWADTLHISINQVVIYLELPATGRVLCT
ncbi:MAG: hypothetical protein EPN17_01005 [Methylobacter sp.]|nr:MAG: hypothetical protein EPN17_01005 [Methylobacter sp.]